MEIQIKRVDDTVGVFKNLKDIKARGEISHVLMELELIKQELVMLWHTYTDDDEEQQTLQ